MFVIDDFANLIERAYANWWIIVLVFVAAFVQSAWREIMGSGQPPPSPGGRESEGIGVTRYQPRRRRNRVVDRSSHRPRLPAPHSGAD